MTIRSKTNPIVVDESHLNRLIEQSHRLQCLRELLAEVPGCSPLRSVGDLLEPIDLKIAEQVEEMWSYNQRNQKLLKGGAE